MTIDLVQAAKEKGIRYFLISFTDLMGTQRAKLVPAEAISQMVKSGAGFAGFATWLDMTPADPDMLIRDADAAMYRAKERGRSRCELFDAEMRARALRSKQIAHQLGLAVGAGKVHCFRLRARIGDDEASDTGTYNRRCSDRIEKSPPPHAAASDRRVVLECGFRITPKKPGSSGCSNGAFAPSAR